MNKFTPDNENAINITPLSTSDYQQWLVLWNAYLHFYNTALPEATSKNTWQNLLDSNTPIYGFGARQTGNQSFNGNKDSNNSNDSSHDNSSELVGLVHVVLHPNTWNTTECCYLEDLYVSAHVRGQGVGRALIEHIYHFAQSKDCNRVYWVTQEDNAPARKLYDSLATLTDMIQYRHDL